MDDPKEERKIELTIEKAKPKPKPPIITKKDDGVFQTEHGKLLYAPDDEFELKSCCGSMCTVDKPFLEFLAKTIVSLSVLGFCFVQLTNGQQSEFASSTISLILGTYLGSTTSSMNKDKKK